MDLKQSLGAGDQQLLDNAEQGEDTIKRAYEKAVAANLPANLAGNRRRSSPAHPEGP